MYIYPVYKALKPHLTAVAPVFFYTGQYAAGKGNTVYRVPALYIEMPRDAASTYWGRGIRVIKNGVIKLHYISNAPFHQHDNTVQDSALQAHHSKLVQINDIIEGLSLKNEHGRLLTQKFIAAGSSELKFTEGHVISVLTYRTELYNYSTWNGAKEPVSETPTDIKIYIR